MNVCLRLRDQDKINIMVMVKNYLKSNENHEEAILMSPSSLQDDIFLAESRNNNSATFVWDFPFFQILNIPLSITITDAGFLILHFHAEHVRQCILPSSSNTAPESIQVGYIKKSKDGNVIIIQELKKHVIRTEFQFSLNILPNQLVMKIPNSHVCYNMAPQSLEQCYSATADEYNRIWLPPPPHIQIPYSQSNYGTSSIRPSQQIPQNIDLVNVVQMSTVLSQLGWTPPPVQTPATTAAPPAQIPTTSTVPSTTAPTSTTPLTSSTATVGGTPTTVTAPSVTLPGGSAGHGHNHPGSVTTSAQVQIIQNLSSPIYDSPEYYHSAHSTPLLTPFQQSHIIMEQKRLGRLDALLTTRAFLSTPLAPKHIIRPSRLASSMTIDTNIHPIPSTIPVEVNETVNDESEEDRVQDIRKVFDDSDENEDDDARNNQDQPRRSQDLPTPPLRSDNKSVLPDPQPSPSPMDISIYPPPNSPMDIQSHSPPVDSPPHHGPEEPILEQVMEQVKSENVTMEETENPDGGLEAQTISPIANHQAGHIQLSREEHIFAANEILVTFGMMKRPTDKDSDLEKYLKKFLIFLLKDDDECIDLLKSVAAKIKKKDLSIPSYKLLIILTEKALSQLDRDKESGRKDYSTDCTRRLCGLANSLPVTVDDLVKIRLRIEKKKAKADAAAEAAYSQYRTPPPTSPDSSPPNNH